LTGASGTKKTGERWGERGRGNGPFSPGGEKKTKISERWLEKKKGPNPTREKRRGQKEKRKNKEREKKGEKGKERFSSREKRTGESRIRIEDWVEKKTAAVGKKKDKERGGLERGKRRRGDRF